MKTGQYAKKQYAMVPIGYEDTFLKTTNDRLLDEFEERSRIVEKEKRDAALKKLKEKVAARMAGTLFDGDTSQVENVVLSSEKSGKKKHSNPRPSRNQRKLF